VRLYRIFHKIPVAYTVTIAVVAGFTIVVAWAAAPNPLVSLNRCRISYHGKSAAYPKKLPALCINLNTTYIAYIDTTEGKFELQLNPIYAPETVNNFIVLAESGYFKASRFSKSYSMIQVSPASASKNLPYGLPNESNPVYDGAGVWRPGAAGMATTFFGISASNFFILTRNDTSLANGTFNYFGRVVSGMNVIRKIHSGDRILSVVVQPR